MTHTIPEPIAQANDLSRHLRNTIFRCRTALPRSMQDQTAGIVGFALRKAVSRHAVIYPGMEKMAQWGRCSERQARKNFARLRDAGVVKVVEYERGGRRSARFVVELKALAAFLTGVGIKLSKVLLEKMSISRLWARKSVASKTPADGQNPELSSAGIYNKYRSPSEIVAEIHPWSCPPPKAGGLRELLMRPTRRATLLSQPEARESAGGWWNFQR